MTRVSKAINIDGKIYDEFHKVAWAKYPGYGDSIRHVAYEEALQLFIEKNKVKGENQDE